MIKHYDLFAGIGGFSLALEEVFTDDTIRHIFCEWESFPTAVLRQHWPEAQFWGDIADLVKYTDNTGLERGKWSRLQRSGKGCANRADEFTIVTGGFPCQPFSHAGRRKGTADDRYQWPNMFAVIRNVKPEWVIAENVRGLVTWNEGMVLETVCADLESEGYEVQPFIIPAVAVGAPHRRDRVWIIANTKRPRLSGQRGIQRRGEDKGTIGKRSSEQTKLPDKTTTNTRRKHGSERPRSEVRPTIEEPTRTERQYPDWSRNWQEVAFATCDDAVDDGLPRLVDGVSYSRAKWRKDSLKAYGNGIVSQVAMEIMRAIKENNDAEM